MKGPYLTKRDFIKLGIAGSASVLINSHLSAKTLSNMIPTDYKLWKWSKEATYYTQR